jgi:hypothetical protein
MRLLPLAFVLALGCGDDDGAPGGDGPAGGDSASGGDGARGDGPGTDGPPRADAAAGYADVGEVCGESDGARDAGARPCSPDLVCCYPCGIPDCLDVCFLPCGEPGNGCQRNGCPGPFP